MSALYLIGVIALWLWLTSLIWKGLRFWKSGTDGRAGQRKWIATAILVLWIGVSFWYSGGRKFYYDWQVDKMCSVDGGIKVYETVRLPAEKFNKWGQPKFYRPNKGLDALGSEYIYDIDRKYFVRGEPAIRSGEVAIARTSVRITRKSDMKLLGEAISYYRAGGDLPGPWMPSGYSCPNLPESDELRLMEKIFLIK